MVFFFFQIEISPLAYVATFSGQLYFRRSYFTLFQSNYFDTTVTFSGQLFLQNSFFFALFYEQLLFRRSYFFRIASFLERNFYRAGFFWEFEVLYGSYFSEQLFYPEELFRIKISKEELIFQSRYFCTVSTFSEKIDFWKA